MGGPLVSMHLGGAHDGRRAARGAFAFACLRNWRSQASGLLVCVAIAVGSPWLGVVYGVIATSRGGICRASGETSR